MSKADKNIKRKTILQISVTAIPILALLIMYITDDPYKVLYSYGKYTDYYAQDMPQVSVNRDFASTEIFLLNYKQQKYNSFVFGSSRSLFIHCPEWEKYIKGSCFHYDGSAESLFGIAGKLRLLNRLNVHIKNCIIVLDPALLSITGNESSHLKMKHPLVSGESRLKFQYVFLSTFLSNKFFMPYIAAKLGLEAPDWLEFPTFFGKLGFHYDTLTNDVYFSSVDAQLKADENGFYEKYAGVFSPRDSSKRNIMEPVISARQKEMLNDVFNILKSDNADYKILIYPNYNEKRFNPDDLKALEEIFGNETVFDYSGVNKFTIDSHNYYDSVHCRPIVGEQILREIYNH